jgi:hypothetical protein
VAIIIRGLRESMRNAVKAACRRHVYPVSNPGTFRVFMTNLHQVSKQTESTVTIFIQPP